MNGGNSDSTVKFWGILCSDIHLPLVGNSHHSSNQPVGDHVKSFTRGNYAKQETSIGDDLLLGLPHYCSVATQMGTVHGGDYLGYKSIWLNRSCQGLSLGSCGKIKQLLLLMSFVQISRLWVQHGEKSTPSALHLEEDNLCMWSNKVSSNYVLYWCSTWVTYKNLVYSVLVLHPNEPDEPEGASYLWGYFMAYPISLNPMVSNIVQLNPGHQWLVPVDI